METWKSLSINFNNVFNDVCRNISIIRQIKPHSFSFLLIIILEPDRDGFFKFKLVL